MKITKIIIIIIIIIIISKVIYMHGDFKDIRLFKDFMYDYLIIPKIIFVYDLHPMIISKIIYYFKRLFTKIT